MANLRSASLDELALVKLELPHVVQDREQGGQREDDEEHRDVPKLQHLFEGDAMDRTKHARTRLHLHSDFK